MTEKEKKNKVLYYALVGLMAALVFAGNYMQIKIPNGGFFTRIHLGNSMCLLAGLLFGRITGGLASGIGAAMFDLFDPAYITSAPFTFIFKFAMGFTAGHLREKGSGGKTGIITAAAAGQLVYIILYLIKSFVKQLFIGEPVNIALQVTGVNAITSVANGFLACVIAVPLYFALSHSLNRTQMAQYFVKAKN